MSGTKTVRKFIKSILMESMTVHRCMDGRLVSPDSEECYEDIMARIEDATYSRNEKNCGSTNLITLNKG